MSLENRPPPQVKPLYASCVKTVDQEDLLQLQSQVQSLTTQQRKMTEEKEREKRKCNLLLGNLEESESESSAITTQKVKDVFDNNMKIHTTPQYVTRIGKATAGRNRLILIKMNSFEEKLQLLKSAQWNRTLPHGRHVKEGKREKKNSCNCNEEKEREGKQSIYTALRWQINCKWPSFLDSRKLP